MKWWEEKVLENLVAIGIVIVAGFLYKLSNKYPALKPVLILGKIVWGVLVIAVTILLWLAGTDIFFKGEKGRGLGLLVLAVLMTGACVQLAKSFFQKK